MDEKPNELPGGVRLHRKRKTYLDDGHTLVWEPGKPFEVSRERRNQLAYYKHNDPVAFRELAEMILVELVRYMVAVNCGEAVEMAAVVQNGSYRIKVSPETIKRYLFTHTAEGAELRMIGKRVGINPNYQPEDDEEDANA